MPHFSRSLREVGISIARSDRGGREFHSCRISPLVWSGHTCPLPLTFFGGQHEREGYDFSRAVKRNQTYPALAAEGFVEERRFSAA